MKSILVVAYAFSPTLGSEFSQGWNYVRCLSSLGKYHVTVLVGSSDGSMGGFSRLQSVALKNVEIVCVEPDSVCSALNFLDQKIGLSWLFVYSLRRWNRLARNKVIASGETYDYFHHLGPVGFKTPSDFSFLGCQMYWGPIGGMQYISLPLAFRSSFLFGLKSIIRNILTYLVFRSNYLRNSVKRFDKFSFATETNRVHFKKRYGVDGPVLSDQATYMQVDFNERKRDVRRIVWCGSLDDRKNVRLLCEIVENLVGQFVDFRLVILGDGVRSGLVGKLVERFPNNVVWLGKVKRECVQKELQASSVFLSTSLSEANTSIFFEAIQNGCIPVAFDLDGFKTNIKSSMGFKIPADSAYSLVVERFSSALSSLIKDENLRSKMRQGVKQAIPDYSWSSLLNKHLEVYASDRKCKK